MLHSKASVHCGGPIPPHEVSHPAAPQHHPPRPAHQLPRLTDILDASFTPRILSVVPLLPPDVVATVLHTAASDVTQSLRQVSRTTGVARETVRELLARYQPVADELRTFQRDHQLGGWQWLYFDTLRALDDAATAKTLTFTDRKNAAITLGIATEKTLLLTGQATQRIEGIHEVGVHLPELLMRLASVAHVVKSERPSAGSSGGLVLGPASGTGTSTDATNPSSKESGRGKLAGRITCQPDLSGHVAADGPPVDEESVGRSEG